MTQTICRLTAHTFIYFFMLKSQIYSAICIRIMKLFNWDILQVSKYDLNFYLISYLENNIF